MQKSIKNEKINVKMKKCLNLIKWRKRFKMFSLDSRLILEICVLRRDLIADKKNKNIKR